MTKLEDTPTPKLYELLSLIVNEEITEEDDFFVNKNDLIETIAYEICDHGYDGDNIYEAMFWFMKGIEQNEKAKVTNQNEEDELRKSKSNADVGFLQVFYFFGTFK